MEFSDFPAYGRIKAAWGLSADVIAYIPWCTITSDVPWEMVTSEGRSLNRK